MRPKTMRHLVLALMLTLASSGLAKADDGNPTVTDQGNNIYLVDGTKGPIPNLLPAEEVQKIVALQSAPSGTPYVLSAISPDDQTALTATFEGTVFLNIHDGTRVPIQPIAGKVQILAQLTDFFWLDTDTIAAYVITDAAPNALILAFDRRTGAGQLIEGIADPTQVPVLVSSDGRKVLLVTLPPTNPSREGQSLVVHMPGAGETTYTSEPSMRDALVRSGYINAAPAGSRARTLLDVAELFDPFQSSIDPILGVATELTVLDTVTGERRFVTALDAGASPREASFSQDGSKFAITFEGNATDPDRGRYDGALISTQTYRDVTGNLPPAQNPYFQGNELLALDFPSGEVKQMLARDGDGAVYVVPMWSTDNQTLLVKMEMPGRAAGRTYPQYYPQYRAASQLRFFNATTMQEIRRVDRVELSYITLRPTFVSPDEVILESLNGLDTHPYYYNWRSGEFRDIGDRAGTFAGVKSTRLSREIVFQYSSFTDPVDFYRMRWDGSGFARLSWGSEEIRQFSQTKQQPVSFTLRNRTTYSGVLILPKDAPFPPKNMPIVVWQEGGPTSDMRNQWAALVESPFGLLPNFGFGVLVMPLYGRYGIGPDRFEALADRTNYGQIDIDAQAEIANQLRTRGWASKVGITGCSYGGYFTTQSITSHPTTYDAAHTMCSLVDLFTEWSRGYASLAPWFEGLPPSAALAEYAKDSPLYNVGKVRTPLLAFHGLNDFLPVTVMENFMLQVINNKVPAKMLKFTEAGHGFPVTSGQYAAGYELYGAQEQLIWFRTYLMQ